MSGKQHPTFLLSPAHVGGRRAGHLLSTKATFPLAIRLREGRATLGEVFSFVSGLYFRGKLTYASAFAHPGDVLVITSNRGLVAADTPISMNEFVAFGTVDISVKDRRYVEALAASVRQLRAARVVFLGSLATRKYLDVLTAELGDRLLVPRAFPGMGDMRRGALLLRAVKEERELEYMGV